jgi:hypothetical protein
VIRSAFILILPVLLFGCENKNAIGHEPVPIQPEEMDTTENEVYGDTLHHSDSVTIVSKTTSHYFIIELTIGNSVREYDLTQMNIPVKIPNEIDWINSEFACMTTWWSQSQSRHIFIPTRMTNEFIYINKDIEQTDSLNNNIVYIDSVYMDLEKIVFKAENLLTRRSRSLELSINEQNGIYPFYDRMTLTKNDLTITTATERKRIGLQELGMGHPN